MEEVSRSSFVGKSRGELELAKRMTRLSGDRNDGKIVLIEFCIGEGVS